MIYFARYLTTFTEDKMKITNLAVLFTIITASFFSISPAEAILPDSLDYKQSQSSAKYNLKNCKANKRTRVNGKCALFNTISHEKSEVYKLVDRNWQPAKLQLFDSPVFGKISSVEIVKFDKEWAYWFTNNKTPGKQLFRFRMSTIHYNYGC
jgi:hypothetical protein